VVLIWIEGDYDIQSTHFCLNTREKRINRARLKFSLYTNCQNRACGKEFSTTTFANLHINNVYVKHYIQGWIQDFKLGGGALKKIVGVFRVKNQDFTPKKSYFTQLRREARKG
jgi:hypothetical protein